jgi:hypothetical protein
MVGWLVGWLVGLLVSKLVVLFKENIPHRKDSSLYLRLQLKYYYNKNKKNEKMRSYW